MQQLKKHMKSILIGTALICFILYPEPVKSGALDGINLCIKTLIPSLFPFMVLTSALLKTARTIPGPLAASFRKVCGIPNGMENIFLISLLGGYPVGAKLTSQTYKSKSLNKSIAQRMLGFCNNAGPAFIFGVIGSMFSSPWIPTAIWLIHIITAIITGCLLPKTDNISIRKLTDINSSSNTLIEQSVQTMGIICGWVILFRILISYITTFIPATVSPESTVIIAGMLELSNGCIQLEQINDPAMRFIICNLIVSFGGFCVAMQTASVVKEIGLGYYFPGKLLQTTLSVIFAFLLQHIFFPHTVSISYALYPIFTFCTIMMLIRRKYIKKVVDFTDMIEYNANNR